MWKAIILCIGLLIVFYILYINGIMVINSKRALEFIGSIRGNGSCKASFKGCSGYMKRVIKFKESTVYKFLLDCELEKGELEVSILDSEKEPVMVLDKGRRCSTIVVDKRKDIIWYLNLNQQVEIMN